MDIGVLDFIQAVLSRLAEAPPEDAAAIVGGWLGGLFASWRALLAPAAGMAYNAAARVLARARPRPDPEAAEQAIMVKAVLAKLEDRSSLIWRTGTNASGNYELIDKDATILIEYTFTNTQPRLPVFVRAVVGNDFLTAHDMGENGYSRLRETVVQVVIDKQERIRRDNIRQAAVARRASRDAKLITLTKESA